MKKFLKAVIIVFIIFIVIPMIFLMSMFRNYSEPSIGYDNNIEYNNKIFDRYKVDLKRANELYFKSDDPYYFFERSLKETIIKSCIDRYFRKNNISEVSGWRFTVNENLLYISENKLGSEYVDKKFTKSLRFLKKKGYDWTDFQQTYKITQKINCNKSIEDLTNPFIEEYKNIKYHPLKKSFLDYLNGHNSKSLSI